MMAPLDPAWILAQRPYGNSGRLLECFSLQSGRFSAVAKGVYRKAHGGATGQLLQVFYPLLIATSGRTELKQLTKVEAAGVALRPVGNAALCGLYLNELLIRLLPRFDPQPELFACYGASLDALSADAIQLEVALRRFELTLLTCLGYTIAWRSDAEGAPVIPAQTYRFQTDQGFLAVHELASASVVVGAVLDEIADWWEVTDRGLSAAARGFLKTTTRQALAVLLGDRPLQTRVMASSMDWGQGG